MGAKKRELKLRVHGDRRSEPDTRRMARAIIRLAIELDADSAQALADTLEHEEALRRRALTRRRAEQRATAQEERG
jgi:hypothetical protein